MNKYIRTHLPEDWEIARGLRNRVTRLLKTEKCNSARRKVEKCELERDSGRVWKNIRNYLGWGGTTSAPTKLVSPAGHLVTSPKSMDELQNNYYLKKVQDMRIQLPTTTTTLQKIMSNRPHPPPNSLALKAVHRL